MCRDPSYSMRLQNALRHLGAVDLISASTISTQYRTFLPFYLVQRRMSLFVPGPSVQRRVSESYFIVSSVIPFGADTKELYRTFGC
jgi:hypothetical protein